MPTTKNGTSWDNNKVFYKYSHLIDLIYGYWDGTRTIILPNPDDYETEDIDYELITKPILLIENKKPDEDNSQNISSPTT